ncbi:LysE/ArgO family amino acid transporter [Defluviimonas sp. WL0024]|uniref:LysE/ArgO family amino acid transporter n=1 Tax=Albidovulum salinarum TaxID=2984153 RepID=A0ABT2XD90_9RHOB|nr:LysE/ArgO family amino acid transporter [Defluviimonas sp. WL0024]MCU9849670.1 LysE/ArgO family amino acid transporter [Defluviimonas sp. WL0024]
MLAAGLSGFQVSVGLIMAIGAQNAFVLRQGLRREHVLACVLFCATSDAVLIATGVAGFAAASAVAPWLGQALRWGGVAFLLAYGLRAGWSALRGGGALAPRSAGPGALGPVLTTLAAITWLNPHVYLDTVVLLGSIAAQYPGREMAFGAGAALGSFAFFFTLGFGARLLAPVFAREAAWRVLDGGVALVMISIAVRLAVG